MKNTCQIIVVLLAATIAAMLYIFIIKGETVSSTQSDTRTTIVLTEAERAIVLSEMRDFLVAIQTITEALAKDEMKTVATAARKVGLAAQEAVPAGLVRKLPATFKKLGFGTHQAFDQLALDAESFGDRQQSLEAMSKLMTNCTSCHAAFQIRTSRPGGN